MEVCDIAVLVVLKWHGLELLMKLISCSRDGCRRRPGVFVNKSSIIDSGPESKSPVGTAVRERKVYCCNDIQNTSCMDPWKDLASKGVRFVSFGSYNKIWKSVALFPFILKKNF
jgi:hypothetical protein